MKRLLPIIVLIATLFAIAPAHAQDSGDRVVVNFSDPARPGLLKVNFISGSISVKTHSGRDVIIESTSGRLRRQFWEAQAAYLDYLDPDRAEQWRREDREAAEHDRNVDAVAAEARAELEQIDEMWGSSAPWN